jgi:hypothetical protein
MAGQRIFEVDAMRFSNANTLLSRHSMVDAVKIVPVAWIDLSVAETDPMAFQLSRALEATVEEWLQSVRSHQLERQPNQLDEVLADLGEMPPAVMACERALWVAALINPLPGLGVAMEVRPAMLQSCVATGPEGACASALCGIATRGIQTSLAHMDAQ